MDYGGGVVKNREDNNGKIEMLQQGSSECEDYGSEAELLPAPGIPKFWRSR